MQTFIFLPSSNLDELLIQALNEFFLHRPALPDIKICPVFLHNELYKSLPVSRAEASGSKCTVPWIFKAHEQLMHHNDHKLLKYLLTLMFIPSSDVAMAFEALQEICSASIQSQSRADRSLFGRLHGVLSFRHGRSIRRSLHRSPSSPRSSLSAAVSSRALDVDRHHRPLRSSSRDQCESQTMGRHVSRTASEPSHSLARSFCLSRHRSVRTPIAASSSSSEPFSSCINIKRTGRVTSVHPMCHGRILPRVNSNESFNRTDRSALKITFSASLTIYPLEWIVRNEALPLASLEPVNVASTGVHCRKAPY